jgi:hypothetical protein
MGGFSILFRWCRAVWAILVFFFQGIWWWTINFLFFRLRIFGSDTTQPLGDHGGWRSQEFALQLQEQAAAGLS